MLKPVNQKHESRTRPLNPLIEQLARIYQQPFGVELYRDQEPKIKLNYLSSKMALFYEKVRYSVDYKEEHLIRRSAIERIVKRIIMISRKDPKVIAETLLRELIRAQYLPNDAIPEEKSQDIARILDKYLKLYDRLEHQYHKEQIKKYHKFLFDIMAAEIEENIIPPIREDALVETMYKMIKNRINILNFPLSDKERNIQIYLAIHRNLIKSDETLLAYYLFNLYVSDWGKGSDQTIHQVADIFPRLTFAISKQLRHPLADLLTKKLKIFAVYFSILHDVMAEKRNELPRLFAQQNALESEMASACKKRYGQARKKLQRGAVRAIIYILFTKVLIATALELPYDIFILGYINYLPLGANVIFHPLLMGMIVLTTKVPGNKNTKKIITGIKEMVYGDEIQVIAIKFKKSLQIGSASWLTINIFYLLMYLLSFGVIIDILRRLGFNIVSGFMFVLFLTLISFFGIRLRLHARDLVVIGKKENIFTFFFDLFSLPIIRAGRWISLKSKRINIFIFILDFIIESPYQFIVASFEDITSFIKEKKEEVN